MEEGLEHHTAICSNNHAKARVRPEQPCEGAMGEDRGVRGIGVRVWGCEGVCVWGCGGVRSDGVRV